MSNTKAELDLKCPVCWEHLICPYSLGCSHNLCAKCFLLLKKNRCPMCRSSFKTKKDHSVNSLLEQLISPHIPDYDKLKEQQLRFIKSIDILSKYDKSTRIYNNGSMVKQYLEEHDLVVKKTDLLSHFKDQIPQYELMYILDQLNTVSMLKLNDEEYVFWLTECNDDDLSSVFNRIKDKLTSDNILHIISVSNPEMPLEIVGHKATYRFCGEDSLSNEDVVEQLVKLSDEDLAPSKKLKYRRYIRNFWAEHSEDLNDSDSDSDTSSGSNSSGGGDADNILLQLNIN